MSKEYLEALKIVDNAIKKYSNMSFNLLEANAILSLEQALKRLEAIENTFADSHICEIQKEFAKYDKLCEETKCEECALGVGDGICLRKTFERKWELQKEVVSPNSVNLLMQELDCKDFAELRKYARCGYEKLNTFKGSKEVKIEIPESSLMDYNPTKHYLKWEDLEFPYGVWENAKVVLNGKELGIRYKSDYGFMDCDYKVVKIFNLKTGKCICKIYDKDKDFFNNLHLQFEKECSNCKKQHTKDCPNSSECYSKKDKPYWERVEE